MTSERDDRLERNSPFIAEVTHMLPGLRTPRMVMQLCEASTTTATPLAPNSLSNKFAIVSVIRGRAARLASIAVLRELERRARDLATDEQLAFGQIQFALGDWADSRRRLNIASYSGDANAATIAIFANALLRKNELEEAKRQIDRVAALEPTAQRTIELQAR